MVGTVNMSTNAPSDAAIVSVKGTKKAIAMTVDCNSRYVHANPVVGTMIAVAEAARNITVSGGVPSAVTNCLNFGNPHNPESYWQFVGAIKGMSAACIKFSTPVTGGNVSFYNQTVIGGKEVPVFPTPTIGMIGVLEEKERKMTLYFKEKGDLIYLVGEYNSDMNSSEYLSTVQGVKLSPAPYFDLDKEFEMHQIIRKMIDQDLINAAHDVSDGGLFVALTEMGVPRGLGFDIETDMDVRSDAFLFGEGQGRVVVTLPEDNRDVFNEFWKNSTVSVVLLGHVTKGKMQIDLQPFGFIDEARDIYMNALGQIIEN
jgi:phosphoribosylformylglycinamidine synthase